ncbi:tectonic-2 isoform X1 [Girardinichthys multiradiatus]|uniref:tectonic-2 isoform X1 n=1 Tax=Girardinichthys multiradiatus TaxID=208333 RepID=UPI001FABA78B|nr:tectonic-2 isoform X1 [Girardinichthys multiradiatus]
MANVGFLPASILGRASFILFFIWLARPQNIVVFQPSFLITNGPKLSSFLLGNTSGVSLNLRRVSASNTTGTIGSSSCVAEATRWALKTEQMGKSAVQVHLTLSQSLRLCGENETNADCCLKPLCVLETFQVSACVGSTPLASLLIQATINARLFPANASSDNKTVFPNQVYQPLGICPCDLTSRTCDARCCCDQDCSNEELKLFASHCLLGPYGGQVSPAPDYQCSMQSAENSPDWFPFLCVTSPLENNPYLGLFYQGDTIAPRPGPSFRMPLLSAPVPPRIYIQGSPVVTSDDKYFTIPQMVLGRCINGAPVAFLQNFKVECVTLIRSCPTGPPIKTQQKDLITEVLNGQGGIIMVNLTDEADKSLFLSRGQVDITSETLVCENVTLALDYKFYWKGNGITSISLTRTVGTIVLNGSLALTTRYSAVFLNGESVAEPNSGNPGYQVRRPVIAGILDNNTELMQRTLMNIWKPVGDGLCSSASVKPVVFGENSTSGCLLPIRQRNITQCDLLRETVADLQAGLTTATYVAQRGNPDLTSMTDWVNISFVTRNVNTSTGAAAGVCGDIPSHQHIRVWSLTTSLVDGIPQREIQALEVSYSMSTWALDCGGGDVSLYENLEESQLFPITSSVTFVDIPINTGPPKTRFQINFTEYDCNRNDVCWPELAFPFTRYYTGEPYSQSLAKGMILVFMFLAAAILGTPWRQIRQAWHNA